MAGVRHLVVLGLSLAAATPIASAQPGSRFKDVERVAIEELRATNTPGAAVAVVENGRLVFARGFGVANIETGEPMTPDRLFVIGSTTKMFTAATLLALADSGRLRLDEPIGTYLSGLSPLIARITAAQLLSNMGGLADGYQRVGPPDDSAIVRTARALTDDDTFLAPGAIFSYANPGFVVAGAVIEATSGRSFGAAVEQRLLGPLGMIRSTFDPRAGSEPRSRGHETNGRDRPRLVDADRSHPAGWTTGGLHTTVLELARFAIAFMDGGRFEGRQVIPASVVGAMSQSHSIPLFPAYRVNNFTFQNQTYGYGSILYDVRGVPVIGHNGDVEGFGSLLRMVPARRFAVIVLANRSGMWLTRTAETAMDVAIGLRSPAPPPLRALPMSDAELRSYAGIYRAPNRGSVELAIDNGQLLMTQGNRALRAIKIGDLRFLAVPVAMSVPTGVIPADDPAAPSQTEFVLLRDSTGIRYLHLQARGYRRE